MSYATEEAQFNENIRQNLTDSPKLPSGYSENFQYGLGQTVDQTLSISEEIVREYNGLTLSDRNDELKELRANGTLTDDEYISFVKHDNRGIPTPDYSAMADFANEKYGTTIRNDASIRKELLEGLASRKRQAAEIFGRQSTMGLVGEVLGGLTGFALEPAGIAAIPLEALMLGRYAYTLSQATTRLGRASRVAGVSAAANMATETIIQPTVFNWHEEIGIDMTWKDALFNIASVGVLGGGVTGLASGLKTKKTFRGEQLGSAMEQSLKANDISVAAVADLLSHVRNAAKQNKDKKTNIAVNKEAEEILERTEEELRSVWKDEAAEDFFNNVDAAQKRVNSYATATKIYDDVEYEIIDSEVDFEFKKRLETSEEMKQLEWKDVVDTDEFLPGEKNSKALTVIQKAQDDIDAIQLCITGGG